MARDALSRMKLNLRAWGHAACLPCPARRDARVARASLRPHCNAVRPTTGARDSRSGETPVVERRVPAPVANAIHRCAQATSGTGAARRSAARAKRRVLDVVDHAGSGSWCDHAGSGSALSSTLVPPVRFSDGGDGHTRLPRGNSPTFLWTSDLGRDRSVEDRSVACQPDSRKRRIVVAIHRPPGSLVLLAATRRSRCRGHWCSSPRLVVTTYAAINIRSRGRLLR